jgi:hypothetical protein
MPAAEPSVLEPPPRRFAILGADLHLALGSKRASALRSIRRLAGLQQRSPKDQGSDSEVDHQSRDID